MYVGILEPFTDIPGFDHIDPVAVRDLLTFDNILSPRTAIHGVNKLEPGCTFVWRFGDREPSIERYWRPPLANPELSIPSEGELEELLDALKDRQSETRTYILQLKRDAQESLKLAQGVGRVQEAVGKALSLRAAKPAAAPA